MEIQFGQYAIAPIMTVVLGLIYRAVPFEISNRVKPILAVAIGIGLSLVYIPYASLDWSWVNVIDYCLHGLMLGASAVGLYELQRTVTKPRK